MKSRLILSFPTLPAWVFALPALSTLPLARGANQTWDGGASGTGTAWLTNTNWLADPLAANLPGASGSNANGDLATVPAGTGPTLGINMNTTGGNYSLGALDFARTTAATWSNSSGTAGTLRLNGATVGGVANTLVRLGGSSNLTIANGSSTMNLAIGNVNGIFDVASARTLTINSTLSEITAGSNFIKTGTGTLFLNPASGTNNLTGRISLAAGILTVTPTGLGNAAKVVLNSTGSGTAPTFNASAAAIFTTPLEVGGAVIMGISGSGGPMVHDTGGITLLGTAATHTLTVENDLIERGVIGDAGNANGILKTGRSQLRLTGNNTFSGGFTFQGSGPGTGQNVFVGHNNALGSGKLTLDTGAVRLASDSSGAITLPNAVDFNADIALGAFNAGAAITVGTTTGSYNSTIVAAGVPTGKLTFSGANGAIRLTGGTRTLTIDADTEIARGIGEDAAGRGLVKAGAALLTLSGASNYSGPTTINAGTVKLEGGGNRLPITTALTLANVAGAVLDMNSQSQNIASLSGGGALGGNISLGSAILTVGDATSTAYDGTISGAGGLSKGGAGTLTLSRAQTYLGLTKIDAGTLEITGSLAGPTTVAGGTLTGTGTVGLVTTIGGTISPGVGSGIGTLTTGAVTLNSTALLTLTINDETAGNLDRIANSGTFSPNSGTLIVTFNDATFTQATNSGDLAAATRYNIITGSVDGTMFGNATLMSAADTAALGLSGAQYEATFSGQRFWLEVGSIKLVPLAPVLVPEPGSTGLLLAALGLARRRRRPAV